MRAPDRDRQPHVNDVVGPRPIATSGRVRSPLDGAAVDVDALTGDATVGHAEPHRFGDLVHGDQPADRLLVLQDLPRLLGVATGLLTMVSTVPSVMAVSTYAGQTVFAVTPVVASSAATERTNPSTPCFDAV